MREGRDKLNREAKANISAGGKRQISVRETSSTVRQRQTSGQEGRDKLNREAETNIVV